MKTVINRSGARALFASGAFFLAVSSAAQAATINFNTDAAGNPYTGLSDYFVAGEYAALGVSINDSDPSAGSTYVNLTNPLNTGTAISGYYANIGAFDGTATSLELVFTAPVTSLGFDYASADGQLGVSLYDSGGNLVSSDVFSSTGTFVNQAGFSIKSGSVSLSGLIAIDRVLITPTANNALIFDNLQFTAVPVPAAVWLLGSGLLGLAGVARGKGAGSCPAP
jgi:hypothetical protein